MESCCTCASILSATPPYPSTKAIPQDRRVACCARVICGNCIYKNNRFAEYCPFCQVSSTPSSLPQGLRDPPSYTPIATSSCSKSHRTDDSAPPPYTPKSSGTASESPYQNEKAALAAADSSKVSEPAEDTLHFLNHEHDSIVSLSLQYDVPAPALRRANNITSDHLLLGRKTIIIPGEFYKGGLSLSPRPVEGEDEELRKAKVRRFMTSTKVADYDIATLYLEQSGNDLSAAVDSYFADEAWERNHPNQLLPGSKKTARKIRGASWRGL